MLVSVEGPLGLYTLTFVLPPKKMGLVEAPNAAVTQIWLLIKSTANDLENVLHRDLLSWLDESLGIHLWLCVKPQSTRSVSKPYLGHNVWS